MNGKDSISLIAVSPERLAGLEEKVSSLESLIKELHLLNLEMKKKIDALEVSKNQSNHDSKYEPEYVKRSEALKYFPFSESTLRTYLSRKFSSGERLIRVREPNGSGAGRAKLYKVADLKNAGSRAEAWLKEQHTILAT